MTTEIFRKKRSHSKTHHDSNEEVNLVLVFPEDIKIDFKTVFGSTIGDLKLSLHENKIVPKDQYYFTFDGRLLHEDWVLKDIGIKNRSELVVNVRKAINIKIESDEDIEFEVTSPSDFLIRDFKEKVAEAFEVDRNVISLEYNGNECDNNSALLELGINDGSIIKAILLDSINVILKYISHKYTTTVHTSFKVSQLIESIAELISENPKFIDLYFNEKYLEEEKKLNEYGIINGSIIEVRVSLVSD